MKSDDVLLTGIKKGDQHALEDLYKKYYYRLCDFAFHYVRSFDLTEEIVSDVFLKIWKKRDSISVTGNFKAYLYTAIRNQALNYIEKEQNQNLLESLEDLDQNIVSEKYHPEQELLFKEFKNSIEAFINTLPPRRRLVFKLSRLEGFTYREIADIMSISVSTVQNQMVEAVRQLGSYAMIDK